MKKQIQTNSNAGQSATEVRKSQKHDVNLQKNSTLYFQIGLILCLLGTFALFEMQFESKSLEVAVVEPDDSTIDFQMIAVKEFVPEAKVVPKKDLPKKIIDEVIEVDNTHKDTIEKLITSEQKVVSNAPTTSLDPEDLPEVIDEPEENIHINRVQFVPVFPGCEKYELNSKRKKCLNEKMGKLVQRKFDKDIAGDYGLSGLQRIYVEFKVDKTGAITDIKTRAPHPQLEKEALRIANKIPKMIPGKMGETPVNVIYNLPITFQVNN